MHATALPAPLVDLLTGHFDAPREQLTGTTTFSDLGMDSLALMELVVVAEEQLGVVLSESAMDLDPGSTLDEAARVLALPQRQMVDTPSPSPAP
ncbi:acyl carrier protein [Streptomyces sp. NPDC052676]|uniref:acyl carrier protein n=1 Tax=Streptomyces sp. NPDC052676 TaxID=3154953 RepID=UPI0034239D5D